VKTVEKHIGKLFVSIAILLVFGNVSFANESIESKEKASIVSELQKDDQSKPFIFDGISIGKASQTVSQHEYIGLGFFGIYYSNRHFSFAQKSSLFNSSFTFKDKRELIFRHLFPFHFFW